MEVLRLCDYFKKYLSGPEVRAVCDSKVYAGVKKIEKEFRTQITSKGINTNDLDDFYKKPPAGLKTFKQASLTEMVSSYNVSYGSWNGTSATLDVYRKILHFVTIVKLVKFYEHCKLVDASATIANSGVSNAVFKRIRSVDDLNSFSDQDMMKKMPAKNVVKYIEMGLKRIISMEVGSDDWDK